MKIKKIKGKRHSVQIFCYICKRYITVTATKELTAEQVFKNGGHYGDEHTDKVPFLAPDFGRNHRRYQRAVARKEAELSA